MPLARCPPLPAWLGWPKSDSPESSASERAIDFALHRHRSASAFPASVAQHRFVTDCRGRLSGWIDSTYRADSGPNQVRLRRTSGFEVLAHLAARLLATRQSRHGTCLRLKYPRREQRSDAVVELLPSQPPTRSSAPSSTAMMRLTPRKRTTAGTLSRF
jgi:hypothetical protein